jgi:hypothetical protein
MDASLSHEPSPVDGALKALAWLGGLLATGVAAVFAAILAVFVAAAVLALAMTAALFLGFTSLAMRSRRGVSAKADPDLIEAKNVGGHSWVAYGWDQSGR